MMKPLLADVRAFFSSRAGGCEFRWRSERGLDSFNRIAGTCHGATGQGNPAMVIASKGALQDLSSKEVPSRTDMRLAKDVAGGRAQKKTIKPLTQEEMNAVIASVPTLAEK